MTPAELLVILGMAVAVYVPKAVPLVIVSEGLITRLKPWLQYVAPAVLRASDDRTVIPMPTSTGAPRQMRKAGTLEFVLKGQPMKLTSFVDLSDQDLNHLTVMFSDLTSGTETYAAGRYIDLDRNATGIYELDFNRAYHPYCYYNETYECPYPPAENRLKIPVRAGERLKRPNT